MYILKAESPKHHAANENKQNQSSVQAQNTNNIVTTTVSGTDSQLKYENDRLKLALAHR